MPVRLRGAFRDAATPSTACAYVGPRSRYANPFTAGARSPLGPPMDAAESVDLFTATLRGRSDATTPLASPERCAGST